ncbi:hypothetical protein V9T40_003638 [Parthenolecanium corni]|uniref:RAD50-interacting protein 1 n=1 Tax=Parthenolecanium corni TaxID=536013 RepID=A0AAN9TR06_9HEMI
MEIENVYRRINQFLGNDWKKLTSCKEFYHQLEDEKNKMESELYRIRSEIPAKIDETTRRIENVQSDILSFIDELKNFLKIYETGDLENSFEKLSTFAVKRTEFNKCLNYLKTVKFIENTSNDLKKFYQEGNWNKCVMSYLSLGLLLRGISSTQCTNILEYLKDVVQYWHKLLKSKLIVEYEQLLKVLNWPFVTRNKALPPLPQEDLKSKFQLLTKLLLETELPEELRVKPIVTSALTIDFPQPSLPIFLLLEPLRKRFLFHFCGNKQTNRSDKPEWMFSQILTWIKDHEYFLSDWMQPVYKGFTSSVKVEFICGLVKMVTEKLHSDLLQLQYDDILFTHTLDETLGFHRELTSNYGYPSTSASVLSVLTQAQIFVKWINMERKYAERRMDDMLNSNTAWEVISENERCKITECGDEFIILLSTITDRYSSLPRPGHRLQFLDFQLELIDDFRLRLVQLRIEDYMDILSSDVPAILNTLHYLSSILVEWGTLPHFLMLHHFKEQMNVERNDHNDSVFTDILELINHFIESLTREICSNVTLEISAKSRSYRRDRWNIMPLMNPDVELGLTLSGCAMFQVLTSKLHQMQNIIAPEIFRQCWKNIADQLCKLLIDDVILVNMFSRGGAQQIQFDVKRNILPLFAQFTPKPEVYFKSLLEACDLLCTDPSVEPDELPFEITALNANQVESILNRKCGRVLFAELT